MTAFEVFVNGTRLCLAGVDGPGVLTAILTRVEGRNPGETEDDRLGLSVGGLDSSSDRHLSWLASHAVTTGDEVLLRVVQADAVDTPVPGYQETAEETRTRKEAALASLAEELGWTATRPE